MVKVRCIPNGQEVYNVCVDTMPLGTCNFGESWTKNMPTPRRLELIRAIETARGSRVLSYITGDRHGFETKIATDVFPFILEHLEAFGSTSKIDLFLYTTGGITIAASGLVSLIREFAGRFSVLIPFKAQSAGTLVALGADSIVMSRVGQLSPVDPTITSPYNPTMPHPVPGNPPQSLPVNVEDVVSFIKLARSEAGIKNEQALAEVFRDLAAKVHPLALGSVYRAREQIKMIARRMLQTHMTNGKEIERITTLLTRELYSHDYIIGRKEATEVLKLPIETADQRWDDPIWSLYKEYENVLELTRGFNPETLLQAQQRVTHTFTRAIIESTVATHAFQTVQEITRVQVTQPGIPTPIVGFQARVISENWVANSIV